jgi:hypothetical protein
MRAEPRHIHGMNCTLPGGCDHSMDDLSSEELTMRPAMCVHPPVKREPSGRCTLCGMVLTRSSVSSAGMGFSIEEAARHADGAQVIHSTKLRSVSFDPNGMGEVHVISDGQHVVSLGTTPDSAISGYQPRTEGVGPDAFVTVQVSRELLEQLSEWSRPVQVKIERHGDEYEMISRDPFGVPARNERS